ncbi:bifunctional adenosylcobinamide kinase/adenosylcobinamide-phosphate guanylyltransferase [Vandammella animalimorsus]|uniref:Adenosylcobinamide kinase n=1 Tax=Vandammella animalimorsus TaxID=2029117 RepID=A0A3M6RTU3_9BURK|nr:bifunctional adenosylcobinamide kinase/adenosylcobinamide-phosphate guanylyltransferase [Vandammella animalimorsus]RMX18171.1 bifunctional adenosylcobinamide kinase/adenosylcobinamide-phosphate guanylyltransferase [Vandammella animalimorsus]
MPHEPRPQQAAGPAHVLLLGGQKSGKSGHAEQLAAAWLAEQPGREVLVIATAQALDEEMRARIARHRQQRRQRLPAAQTLEEPLQLAASIAAHSAPQRLLLVDCLTLWLTNWLMPAEPAALAAPAPAQGGLPDGSPDEAALLRQRRAALAAAKTALLQALAQARGPVVLVSNEMGWGVMPLGRAVRAYADELGLLNQALAQHCRHVLLVAAGQAIDIKALAQPLPRL